MNFVTQQFILFFLFALALCLYTSTNRKVFIPALILCNLVFYSTTGLKGILVLIAVAFIAWAGGKNIIRHKKKFYLILCIAALLSVLALFKYYEFFLLAFFDMANFTGLRINIQPFLAYNDFFVYITGLSFFSFQAIAYLADCYTAKITASWKFFDVLAYLSFFPTVCAGPIMRPNDFISQAYDLPYKDVSLSDAACLILSGLIKKVVIASYLSEHIVRTVFSAPDACSSLCVLLGIYGYSVQIYCDFSGYSDLAMGIGRLMGFRIPQNFNNPYLAFTIQDFWRRWHISLSSWLKDYLYIPLGGSRRGNTYINLMLTMVLGGLWHGSAWTFVLWGALHGAGLVLHRFFSKITNKKFSSSLIWKTISWMLTFNFVSALWVFFRADDLQTALSVFRQLIAFEISGSGCSILTVLAIFSCFFIQAFGRFCFSWLRNVLNAMHWLGQAVLFGLLVIVIMSLGPEGTLPFIYFGF